MRRTSPKGVPIVRASSNWDDVTQPGMSEYELTEMRRRRAQKLSLAYEMVLQVQSAQEDLKRRMGNAEMALDANRRDLVQIKEGQVGLLAVAEQIMSEIKKRNDNETAVARIHMTESGAWKRQLLAVAVAAGALIVSVIVAASRC